MIYFRNYTGTPTHIYLHSSYRFLELVNVALNDIK